MHISKFGVTCVLLVGLFAVSAYGGRAAASSQAGSRSEPISERASASVGNASADVAGRASSSEEKGETPPLQQGLSLMSTIVQIAFYIVVASVTVLTYKSALRTVLQPIKTEVFKQQLQELSAVLRLFVGKGECELREDFAFDELFRANSWSLVDDYALLFFDLRTDVSKRPYNSVDCPVILASPKSLRVCDDHILPQSENGVDSRPDPETKAALWAKHKHEIIPLPRKTVDAERSLDALIGSPLLPRPLLELLLEYKGLVNKNIMMMGDLLTECAPELPSKYPNREALQQATPNWIHHRYVARFYPLEEVAKQVTDFIRQHYEIDKLLV